MWDIVSVTFGKYCLPLATKIYVCLYMYSVIPAPKTYKVSSHCAVSSKSKILSTKLGSGDNGGIFGAILLV